MRIRVDAWWLVIAVMGLVAVGCGKSAEDRCAAVHQASCPADHPRANPDFAYTQSACVTAADSACSSEFDDYLDCLAKSPICCEKPGADGAYQCTSSSCSQEAYGKCVSQQYAK
jgi:hypothetical protein